MKGTLVLFLGVIASMSNNSQPVHVSNRFQFVVGAPLSRASSLFGPQGERCWAGEHWNPEFLHPQPGKDVQGAVFTVHHGAHNSVWVTTVFDLAAGRMQYVSFVPGNLVSIIDVRLTALDSSRTSVEVTYARTAIEVAANDLVEVMGKRDEESGPEWQHAIEACLRGGK